MEEPAIEDPLEEDPLDLDSDISTWSEGEFDDDFGVGGGATELPKFQ